MIKKLIAGFGYAIKGIVVALRTQQNMRIHFVAVAVVTVLGFLLDLNAAEWAIIALTIGSVITAEMMNTAIEMLVNMVSPEYNQEAGRVKDIAAGGVLLAAIIATVVAVYIFGNKIFDWLV